MAILTIIRGAPGSGKSTAAQCMFPGTLLLENDQFLITDGKYIWSKERLREAIAFCMSTTKIALERGRDVVVANTFTKVEYIEHYQEIADKAGAKLEVYRCIGDFKNVHGLDDEMVQKFKDSMEDWPGEVLVDPKEIAEKWFKS